MNNKPTLVTTNPPDLEEDLHRKSRPEVPLASPKSQAFQAVRDNLKSAYEKLAALRVSKDIAPGAIENVEATMSDLIHCIERIDKIASRVKK